MSVEVLHGDCINVMRSMPPESIDAVVCDPPYGLQFMSKEWDRLWRDRSIADTAYIAEQADSDGLSSPRRKAPTLHSTGRDMQEWHCVWAVEALRVLKPGGHLMAFGGARTHHRLMCGLEDAGFEIRDCLMWLYGSGFPKSLDVSKAIDKTAGAAREVVSQYVSPDGCKRDPANRHKRGVYGGYTGVSSYDVTAPATVEAQRWQGWGAALKPAYEPIILGRKPLIGTVAENVQAHGTGALNIDACRIGSAEIMTDGTAKRGTVAFGDYQGMAPAPHTGRWPANVVLDEEAAELLDEQTGELTSGNRTGHRTQPKTRNAYGVFEVRDEAPSTGDSGGASRFFYCAKASRAERGEDNTHPTVKPLALSRYLCRLVTPPGGTILDPFAGSGSTLIAAMLNGFNAVGIEREEEYVEIIRRRIEAHIPPLLREEPAA